jgi:adenine-specific DNA-methyltransferase
VPTLDWIGKSAVVNHHREVPTRLLHCDSDLSFGDPEAGNLLVQGDNLEALKALLPYYAGKVKCIYIDPPYNTGNEGWVYNDNVNSPQIKAWLGSVVGREAEDLSRHDKWLCMIYPRLRLLREFLSDDGAIWISIDDNEAHSLKLVCDEIFGRMNFVSNIIWQKKYSTSNDAMWFSESHDHIMLYALNKELWRPNKLERKESANALYKNPDNDPRGDWLSDNYTCNKNNIERPNLYYSITHPTTGMEIWPKKTAVWRYSRETHLQHIRDDLIWWGEKKENSVPRFKRFKPTESTGRIPDSVWLWEEVGHNQDSKREQMALFPDAPFATPKPEKLIEQIINIGSRPGDLVLDSFSGSGTTGAVAQKLGRNHLSIEMGDHAESHIAPRYRKVIEGTDQGGISRSLNWTGGGGFRFCTLGNPLFDQWGGVSEGVTFGDLAAFVFFSDTGSPIPAKATGGTSLLGEFQGRVIHLLFAPGSIGVADASAGNVLTLGVLETLPAHDGPRVVYAEGCTVPSERLAADGVVFKQVPYQLQAT